jgi:hypothetical protein
VRRAKRWPSPPVYIYALIDPRNNSVRYVGQTLYPTMRLHSHNRPTDSLPKSQWIRELSAEGHTARMEILEETTKAAARVRELYWIAEHLSRGAALTNVRGISTALWMQQRGVFDRQWERR